MPTSPRHSTAKPLLTSVGAASPTPRTSNVQAPTFQSVSGSGASVETILNLGTILPKIPLVDRKGRYTVVSADSRPLRGRQSGHYLETIRFLARFSVLFPCGRSTPPEAWTSPIYPLISLRTVKKQTRRNSRRVLICQKVSQSSLLWSLEKIQSVFFAAARTPQKTLCAQRSVAAAPIAGQGVERSESRLVKKGIALFDQAQDSSIRSLSSSSPESLRNRSSRSSTVSFARSSPATSRTIFP